LKAIYQKHILEFKRPSGTSRGILKTKETWFLILRDDTNIGIGECGILRGLSVDDVPHYEEKLQWVCEHIDLGEDALYKELAGFPSIQIGLEIAFMSLAAKDPFILLPSSFTEGNDSIPINGLVWMGEADFMKRQIIEKMDAGFSCIKMKIGAIDFSTELELLKGIRKEFSPSEIELRVDANGAFSPSEALEKLKRLSALQLHSIEQPIAVNQWEEMAQLCELSPLPIALDEELIGITSEVKKKELLTRIKPQYIILKPSFIGGFQGTDDWIDMAEKQQIGWWITSALESNIGLNAIAQYTYGKQNNLPQGLGTGSLFSNNIAAPLHVSKGALRYDAKEAWKLDLLKGSFYS